MAATYDTFTLDTFSALIDWTLPLPGGGPKDLTDAQVVATARGPVGDVAMTGVVTDGPNGLVRVSTGAGVFVPGVYNIQVRVTKDGDTRTRDFAIDVEQSLPSVA